MLAAKKVLVISGVTGMGGVVSASLAGKGFSVVATHDPSEEADAVALAASSGVETISVNLADRDSVQALIASASKTAICGLVNAAGYFEFENFDDFDLAVWDKSFEVNVRAPLAILHGLKGKLESGASVVNISTTDAFVGGFASSAWAASKAAAISMSKSFANNLGSRSIRVNSVAVGWVGNLTEMGDNDVQRDSVEITPLGRLGSQQEVADVVLFLLSDSSSFVNGTTVVVDGGYTGVDIIGQREARSLA
jgi:NAD(P)-dependent dehydrogenase (short-subunit alcohol dehydrogenase family)